MDSKTIFPLIRISEDREALKSRLFQTSGRIVSLNTLIQDTLFIERPARALHNLCPPKFKGSFKKVMLSQWNTIGTGGLLEVQTKENEFTTIQRTESSFSASVIQLWLFACRHFIHHGSRVRSIGKDFKWSTDGVSLNKLAILASRLGFKSDQISLLQNKNLGQHMAQGFFESLCREDFYKYEHHRVRTMSNRLQSILHNLPKYVEEESTTAQFTTNDPELEASHRFNSPTRDEYDQQRRNIFANQIFVPDQPQSEYVTSLGVTKDIISCFFGKTLFHQLWNVRQATPPQSPRGLAEALPESVEVDMDFEEELPAAQPANPLISEEVNQPSTRSGPDTTEEHMISEPPDTTEEDMISASLELNDHPSGTPDRDIAPLAVGFEEMPQPMETRSYITVHRKVPEILSMWYQSHQEVIVVYLFESRIYYKFSLNGGFNLRAILQDLARDHVFVVVNQYGLGTPDVNRVCEEALKERLILVGKTDNPSQEKGLEGTISLDKLRDYVLNYDVHTGKRKADSAATRPGKRQKDRTS
jgi:hypothetical protein